MALKGGTNRSSCAACKYQRRKCTPQCVLASYFPANQPKKFQNAHRLFGVRNIMKILENLQDEDQKADAMKSIIFESDMREKFPVYGCVECISYLRQQLQITLQELDEGESSTQGISYSDFDISNELKSYLSSSA
ncbi:hypothetical protein HAX54_017056 [Datura stramonium]|uniref:LOB domain-containing protein n=1 Tax=Datura stramonium TaxID=4076 RepID=A0ABS8UK07_DATST|nr:hypothetical protein [Datura stramonium]